ncbi:MAG TPA: hypothetical protein VGC20_07345, partial [bacterium]
MRGAEPGAPEHAGPLERRRVRAGHCADRDGPECPLFLGISAAGKATAWQEIAWRRGSKGALVKQFARLRVHRAGKHGKHLQSCGWLIGERPRPGHSGDPRYYFAWGLDDLTLAELVDLVHVRWIICA